MLVFYSDPFTFPLPAGHRFPLEKYRLLRERVGALDAGCGAELQVAPRALREELLLVHARDYVDAFITGRLDGEAMARIGFPWSTALVERTLRSVGGTVAATRAAVRADGGGCAAYLAGGTHHARRDRGGGYCVFNDVAIAALVARQQAGVRRVLVVDTDVHQGDGTAAIFADDPAVFTFSIHGEGNFPGRKATSDLDVALPDRTGDAEFLAALTAALDRAFAQSRPELVFYLSGADAFDGDRLGRLAVSKAALAERDRIVFARCRDRGARVVTVMGGGYGADVRDTVDVHLQTVQAALAHAAGRAADAHGAGMA